MAVEELSGSAPRAALASREYEASVPSSAMRTLAQDEVQPPGPAAA
jgi:hypothetical protein